MVLLAGAEGFCCSGYHIHLVLNNRTTLEAFRSPVFRRGPDKDGFSLGKRGNISEVFGDTWWRMAVPIFSSFGDGLTFPQRSTEDPELGVTNHRQADISHSIALVTDTVPDVTLPRPQGLVHSA